VSSVACLGPLPGNVRVACQTPRVHVSSLHRHILLSRLWATSGSPGDSPGAQKTHGMYHCTQGLSAPFEELGLCQHSLKSLTEILRPLQSVPVRLIPRTSTFIGTTRCIVADQFRCAQFGDHEMGRLTWF
jgi:hypothetical protein